MKMVLKNKLDIENQVELNRAEERLSKQKAKQLFDSGEIDQIKIGTFEGLCQIHKALFEEIYVVTWDGLTPSSLDEYFSTMFL